MISKCTRQFVGSTPVEVPHYIVPTKDREKCFATNTVAVYKYYIEGKWDYLFFPRYWIQIYIYTPKPKAEGTSHRPI